MGTNLHITTGQEHTPDNGTGVDTMMIWPCTPSAMTDTGNAEDSAVLEDTSVVKAVDCPLQRRPLRSLFRKFLQ